MFSLEYPGKRDQNRMFLFQHDQEPPVSWCIKENKAHDSPPKKWFKNDFPQAKENHVEDYTVPNIFMSTL